ncbi:MAG: ABC transporter ATP-binding protein [Chloroflexi bacterium]|nr:ABC transporter ATP-binding protein [Chloroflexota bacterium]
MASLIDMRKITKIYPNEVVANDRVDFSVEPGEIHALVGENGAGKTTLMKILYGLEQPTQGEIWLWGKRAHIPSPHVAIALGIGMVHQNFMLVPSFTVAQNIVLGQEPENRGFIDITEAIQITEDLSKQYGLSVMPMATVESIPVGMRQRVEILKALYRGAKILILDEPSSVLTPQETRELFAAVRKLVEQGKTVIFITHKLREVKEVSDRVTVMRNGRVMGTMFTPQATEVEIARMMVGREVFMSIDKPPLQRGGPVLQVRGLTYMTEAGHVALQDVSLNVYAGEILGIAGVEGNGQTELVEVLTGLRRPTSGSALVDSTQILGRQPRQIREVGVAHIPEDRLTNGLALGASLQENLIVDRYYRPPFAQRLALNLKLINHHGDKLIKEFDIRAPDGQVPVSALSGGNMQKVVIAREFSANPRLLIAAQPTRGIDVGATEFVHQQIVRKRSEGCAVLLVSADLSEVMSLADRIAVMYNGQIVGIFPEAARVTEEEYGLYMLGLKRQERQVMEAYL